jgi:hypothetical protein
MDINQAAQLLGFFTVGFFSGVGVVTIGAALVARKSSNKNQST